jgi:hypothetical protein
MKEAVGEPHHALWRAAGERTLADTGKMLAKVLTRADAATLVPGAVVLRVGRDVVLDMVEAPVGDWVRVRHRDGANGFIHVNQVFGL